MDDRGQKNDTPASADGVTERNPSIPASEEGTGIVPEDEGGSDSDTHLPASEEDSGLIGDEGDAPAQSWPGGGGPGTFPPPG